MSSTLTEYYYWSERMTTDLLNIKEQPKRTWTFGLNLGFFKFNISSEEPTDTRTAKVRTIEQHLADEVVTDLRFDQPINYAAGFSPVAISAIQTVNRRDLGVVNAFIPISHAEEKVDVAVCLFGSRKNVCGQDPAFAEWRGNGYTVSNPMGMETLLQATLEDVDPETLNATVDGNRNDIDVCRMAYTYSTEQGDPPGLSFPLRPWRRSYTLGHYRNAEWFARIYHTATFSRNGKTLYILVGAPIWIRSSEPRAWVSYADPAKVIALNVDGEPPVMLKL